MNYKLIMLDNPILVSDEQIKGGDFYFKDGKVLQWVKGTSVTYTHVHPSNYPKPIITGIEGLPKLDLSLIADEIGWVDVEKLVQQSTLHIPINQNDSELVNLREYYKQGILIAQSLNEKKYSDEDLRKAWEAGMRFIGEDKGDYDKMLTSLSTYKEYLVEVEMENSAVKDFLGHPVISEIPKITNNIIKVTKIIKQL